MLTSRMPDQDTEPAGVWVWPRLDVACDV